MVNIWKIGAACVHNVKAGLRGVLPDEWPGMATHVSQFQEAFFLVLGRYLLDDTARRNLFDVIKEIEKLRERGYAEEQVYDLMMTARADGSDTTYIK